MFGVEFVPAARLTHLRQTLLIACLTAGMAVAAAWQLGLKVEEADTILREQNEVIDGQKRMIEDQAETIRRLNGGADK